MFKVAGVSTHNGKTKVRFANDLVSRIKMLVKGEHTDINLMELPQAMTKPEAVTYLKTTDLVNTPLFAEAIATADEKYNGVGSVKVSKKVEKEKPTLDSIRAKAGIEV